MTPRCTFFRDSSNESGATDAVGLSMNMSEMDDTEMRGKKKRGRPGKQALVCCCYFFGLFPNAPSANVFCPFFELFFSPRLFSPNTSLIDGAVGQQEAPEVADGQGRERRPGSGQGQRSGPAQRRRRRPRHPVRGGQAGQERHAGACRATQDENIFHSTSISSVFGLHPSLSPAPLLFHTGHINASVKHSHRVGDGVQIEKGKKNKKQKTTRFSRSPSVCGGRVDRVVQAGQRPGAAGPHQLLHPVLRVQR